MFLINAVLAMIFACILGYFNDLPKDSTLIVYFLILIIFQTQDILRKGSQE